MSFQLFTGLETAETKIGMSRIIRDSFLFFLMFPPSTVHKEGDSTSTFID